MCSQWKLYYGLFVRANMTGKQLFVHQSWLPRSSVGQFGLMRWAHLLKGGDPWRPQSLHGLLPSLWPAQMNQLTYSFQLYFPANSLRWRQQRRRPILLSSVLFCHDDFTIPTCHPSLILILYFFIFESRPKIFVMTLNRTNLTFVQQSMAHILIVLHWIVTATLFHPPTVM